MRIYFDYRRCYGAHGAAWCSDQTTELPSKAQVFPTWKQDWNHLDSAGDKFKMAFAIMRRPPPHFDYWHTSLISQYLSLPITIFTLSYLTGRVLWLGSTAQFWVYPPLQLPSPAGWLPQFSPWQWSVLATRWCGVYSQDERQVIFNSSNLPVSVTALFIMTFFQPARWER